MTMTKTLTSLAVAISVLGAATAAFAGPGGKQGGKFFKRADINGDGKISIEEAAEVRAQRFVRLDTNGDGAISEQEFVVRKKANARRETRRKKRFQKFDNDSNGLISQIEWDAKTGKRFAKVDLNADGFITREEVKTFRQQRKLKRQAK